MSHQTFEIAIGSDQLPAAFGKKLDKFQYTGWTLFGLHLALEESPRFLAEKFDPNISRTLKWCIGAETMEDLFAALRRCRRRQSSGDCAVWLRPLSLLDPTQAPPGKHTTYAWHVMPLRPTWAIATTRPSSRNSPIGLSRTGRGMPQHDAQEHHRPAMSIPRMNTPRSSPTCATATSSWGVQRRSGDVQPFRLSHADRGSTWPARPDIRAAPSPVARVHQRRHHRARSWFEAVVEAVGCRRGAGLIGTGGGLVQAHRGTAQ